MSKTLNHTDIDWALNPDGTPGCTLNLWTGCLNHKEGYCLGGDFPCYAYNLAWGRMKGVYLANDNIPNPAAGIVYTNDTTPAHQLDPFFPRFWPSRLEGLEPHNGKARGVFINSMSEWAGPWVPEDWIKRMFDVIQTNKKDRFYLCTKQPQRLPEFSPYPENCWIGATVTSSHYLSSAAYHLAGVKARVKFLSIEPLLSPLPIPDLLTGILKVAGVNWVIIGACTGTENDLKPTNIKYPELILTPMDMAGRRYTLQPKPEWVRDIISAADKLKIPVFLKESLGMQPRAITEAPDHKTPGSAWYYLRKEMPKL